MRRFLRAMVLLIGGALAIGWLAYQLSMPFEGEHVLLTEGGGQYALLASDDSDMAVLMNLLSEPNHLDTMALYVLMKAQHFASVPNNTHVTVLTRGRMAGIDAARVVAVTANGSATGWVPMAWLKRS